MNIQHRPIAKSHQKIRTCTVHAPPALLLMETVRELRYNVYVVLLTKQVVTLPQMRLRNPKRDSSKPFVYVGLTPLRVNRRFDCRRATPKTEWRVQQFGLRLMPELHKQSNPMTLERALRTAKKLAEDLRAKGFGVANGISANSQSYGAIVAQADNAR